MRQNGLGEMTSPCHATYPMEEGMTGASGYINSPGEAFKTSTYLTFPSGANSHFSPELKYSAPANFNHWASNLQSDLNFR